METNAIKVNKNYKKYTKRRNEKKEREKKNDKQITNTKHKIIKRKQVFLWVNI